jgi:hypothetical protein
VSASWHKLPSIPRSVIGALHICVVLIVLLLCAQNTKAQELQSQDALIRVLVSKGVLDQQEAESLRADTAAEQRDRLVYLLGDKGILSAAEVDELSGQSASAQVSPALLASTKPMLPAAKPVSSPPTTSAATETPKVIPAVVPLRVLQLEPSTPGGMIPDLKLGSGAKIKLYGLVKASTIYDSSSPYGTDMPMPAFIGSTFDPGPHSSEFHAKARFARIGANFEWPHLGDQTSITGKFEFDFEGNFTRTLNRNISTIRSSQASIRLAYGRIDHRFSDRTSIFGLFGQDWTPFGSSTLPNLFETTGMGLGFGTLYERAPQFRFGVGHKLGSSRNIFLQPEFALVMPAFGNDPSVVDNQLGYGERQGADSGRPEYQSRLVTQWQLDRAPGVPPAQLVFSGVYSQRYALVRAAQVPAAFRSAFPDGADADTNRYGWTGELQLPTRYATLLFKYWNGADLRWYFVGSLFSNFNDTAGLTCPGSSSFTSCTAASNDGASSVVFGQRADGTLTIAPQRPVRSTGGFVNLGIPLSRVFQAEPGGRAAGWQLYFHYALDMANPHDVRHIGNERQKNDLGAATLFYKMNNLVSFVFEESYYRTRAVGDPTGTVPFPIYRGYPAREWHDLRTEIGPIFSF